MLTVFEHVTTAYAHTATCIMQRS